MNGKLPLGMTKTPLGFPAMFGAFLGCAEWAIGSEDVRADYLKATGIDLVRIVPRNGLDAMIDKATGYDPKEAISAFLDWLVVEIWGEEGND